MKLSLSAASKILPCDKRGYSPFLACALIEKDTISGTDLECTVTVLLDAIYPTCVVNNESLRALPATANIAVDGATVTVTSAIGSQKIKGFLALDFPCIEREAHTHSVLISSDTLELMLMRVSYAMATHDERYYLNGLHIAFDSSDLTLTATDGCRLARYIAPHKQSLDDKKHDGFIVPCATIKTLEKVLKLYKKAPCPVEIRVCANQVLFKLDGVDVHSKLVDGKFPDVDRVIPKNSTTQIEIKNDKETMQALTTALKGSNKKYHGARLQPDHQANKIKIMACNQDEEVTECSIGMNATLSDGKLENIGLNVSYIIDTLKHLKAETVVLGFTDSISPCVIMDGFSTHVIMPMRL